MLFTSGLLGLLYVVFAVVLFSVLNVGLAPMLVIVVGLAFFQYYTSDKIALAASGAKIVSAEEAPELHAMVERLCAMAGPPEAARRGRRHRRPERVRDRPQPEARGGRGDDGALAAARAAGGRERPRPRALARREPRRARHDGRELLRDARRAAHPLRALRRDVRRRRLGGGSRNNNNNQVPVWLIVFLVSIVVYAISFVLIRTISRYREYAADRGSALITGAPENLMSALQKISSGITQIPQRDLREVQGMNAFFIIPTNWKTQMSEWMMDHPPLEKRLAALSEIAREMGRPCSTRALRFRVT